MKTIINNLSCPREMIAYSRKIRPLEEMGQFKANEHFNRLLYLSPLIFGERICQKVYTSLISLVFGIRLLLESSSPEKISVAKMLLDRFCENIAEIHQNERIETINVHSLTHLADQVRRFGPLFTFSAMSFEAANRTLGEVFTGSTSECSVICRRVPEQHRLAHIEISNSKLEPLVNKFSGKEEQNKTCFASETIETDAVKQARRQYPNGVIFNRQLLNNVYLDSTSFGRSKLGNCYVFFMEDDREVFGEIQYFIKIPSLGPIDEVLANVRLHATLEEVGRVKGFIYHVARTCMENLVPLQKLRKVFRYQENSDADNDNLSWMVKLCSIFEHS